MCYGRSSSGVQSTRRPPDPDPQPDKAPGCPTGRLRRPAHDHWQPHQCCQRFLPHKHAQISGIHAQQCGRAADGPGLCALQARGRTSRRKFMNMRDRARPVGPRRAAATTRIRQRTRSRYCQPVNAGCARQCEPTHPPASRSSADNCSSDPGCGKAIIAAAT